MKRFNPGEAPHDGTFNPNRLFRIPERGMIFGVCAGLADYFGLKDWQVRAIVMLFLVVFPPQTMLVYLIAAFFMKRRPAQLFRSEEEEEVWRGVHGQPERTLHSLRHKFRELEDRLAGLERHVTSPEYSLDRQFRDLEK